MAKANAESRNGLVVTVVMKVKPGKIDEVVGHMTKIRAHVESDEPDTWVYRPAVDRKKNVVTVHEVYADKNALRKHSEGEAAKKLLGASKELLVDTQFYFAQEFPAAKL